MAMLYACGGSHAVLVDFDMSSSVYHFLPVDSLKHHLVFPKTFDATFETFFTSR